MKFMLVLMMSTFIVGCNSKKKEGAPAPARSFTAEEIKKSEMDTHEQGLLRNFSVVFVAPDENETSSEWTLVNQGTVTVEKLTALNEALMSFIESTTVADAEEQPDYLTTDEVLGKVSAARRAYEQNVQIIAVATDLHALLDEIVADQQRLVADFNLVVTSEGITANNIVNLDLGNPDLLSNLEDLKVKTGLFHERVAAEVIGSFKNEDGSDLNVSEMTVVSTYANIQEQCEMFTTLHEQLTEKRTSDAELRARLEQTESALAEKTAEAQAKEESLATVSEALTEKEAEVATLGEQVTTGQASIETLTNEVATKDAAINDLSLAVEGLERTVASLNSDLEEKNQQLATLAQEKEANGQEVVRLSAELAQVAEANSALNEQLESAKAEAVETEAALEGEKSYVLLLEAELTNNNIVIPNRP